MFWAFQSQVIRGRAVTTGDSLSGVLFSVKDKKAYDVKICTGSYNEVLDLEISCVEDDDEYWDTSYDNKILSKVQNTYESSDDDDDDEESSSSQTADEVEILYDNLWNWTYKVNEDADSPTVMVEDEWTDIKWVNKGCDHFPAFSSKLMMNILLLLAAVF